jgi:hypothetical protein
MKECDGGMGPSDGMPFAKNLAAHDTVVLLKSNKRNWDPRSF